MNKSDLFYRYRSLSNKQAVEWVIQSINHSIHYFTSPLSFNDPFDCNPNYIIHGQPSKIAKYLQKILSRRTNLNRHARRVEAKRRLDDPHDDPRRPENMKAIREYYHNLVTSKVGILCLTTVPDDLLMWAHYADSHRGICLVFDNKDDFLQTSQPIIYKKTRPIVNPLTHTDEQMLDSAMFTKSDHWSYEREWRILQYKKNGHGLYTLPPTSLIGVILGAKISNEHRELILNCINSSGHNIFVQQASLSSTMFQLEIN